MQQFGTENLSAYLRKMALDGYVVKLELPELKELVSLMRRNSNNLNQLTRKVHETGRVYDADLEDISQPMFLLHLRCGQAVFSHESALFFHDLTDREPSAYAITVRRGYSTTRLKAEGLSVYTIKPELYEVGLTTGQNTFWAYGSCL